MGDETCVPKSAMAVDGVLKEVDYQVRKLDECVGKMASEMLYADAASSKTLVEQALDANKKSCILAELRVLLQQQKQKEGGDAVVPQAVLDLIQMGRSSTNYHLERAFGEKAFPKEADGVHKKQ